MMLCAVSYKNPLMLVTFMMLYKHFGGIYDTIDLLVFLLGMTDEGDEMLAQFRVQ